MFGGKFLAVFHEEMSLNVTRTSPLETAEQALSRSLVYVLPVPCKLLGTPKAFVAIGTDSWFLAVRVTIAAVLPVGGLDSCMSSESGSVETSLVYVSSDHEKTWRYSPRRSTTGVAAPLATERERRFQGLDPRPGHRVAQGRCKGRQFVTPPH